MSLESLLSKLDTVARRDEALKKAIGITCKDVQRDAVSNVSVITGDLRKSIKTDVKVKNGEIVGKVFTNLSYAPYVEFGTGPVGEANKPDVPIPLHYKQDKWLVNIPGIGIRYISGMKPRPYLYPAFLANKDRILKNLASVIKKDLERLRI